MVTVKDAIKQINKEDGISNKDLIWITILGDGEDGDKDKVVLWEGHIGEESVYDKVDCYGYRYECVGLQGIHYFFISKEALEDYMYKLLCGTNQ